MNEDAVREVKYALGDARRLCDKLGLSGGKASTRQAGGYIIRCPVHDERTPSCSVQTRQGIVLWRCHGCGATGDALSLVAAVHGLTMRGDDFKQVLIIGAELGGLHSLVHELETGEEPRERPKPIPRPEPEPDRDYPPAAEVAALWASTTALDPEATEWARARELDALRLGTEVGGHALARSLPAKGQLPWWASYQQRSWRDTGHRVIVPVFDHHGAMRSMRAIRVTEGESPKRLPPGGHRASGVVLVCDIALGWLRGTFEPARILIVEGEPDLLTWATRSSRHAYARVGIVSGSWTSDFATRVPAEARVFLATHDDPAGQKYADDIAATLPRHEIFRWQPKEAAA